MHNIHNIDTPMQTLDLGQFHGIDINLYPLFIAIFEQQSISKAAHLLCISQSAASHALQRLRSHLKDELFLRSGHKMRPTALSEQVYPSIKIALLQIQSISFPQKQFTSNMLHNLKIAVHDEVEPVIFPKIVEHFQQLNNQVQFASIKLNRKNVLAELNAQQIDFFIDVEHNFSEKIASQTLVQDQFVVCSQQAFMDKDHYLQLQHIGVSSRRSGILIEDIYLKHEHSSRQIFLRCQHYSTALQILAQQPDAVLTLPKHVLVHLKIADNINIFDAPFDFPAMNLNLFWLKSLDDNPRISYLKQQITALFA
ncbi:LysR family transcriptional regulator [Acinetobacter rudis]|uniref:LysR family transcriptional regulator n=1 Tax=Acinetobacter rudis TaxID=632955 RepID=A0AAW8J5H8_9GAMM|nr:LysR family transcriptional regulator [Acinetobacter rudis]MDQ8934424.1 LysR family transcriptional regulator [Acinetobacter rudis]MDQ9016676.1 LysR family transcriptional regulator [Acinetobacter rudis]